MQYAGCFREALRALLGSLLVGGQMRVLAFLVMRLRGDSAASHLRIVDRALSHTLLYRVVGTLFRAPHARNFVLGEIFYPTS